MWTVGKFCDLELERKSEKWEKAQNGLKTLSQCKEESHVKNGQKDFDWLIWESDRHYEWSNLHCPVPFFLFVFTSDQMLPRVAASLSRADNWMVVDSMFRPTINASFLLCLIVGLFKCDARQSAMIPLLFFCSGRQLLMHWAESEEAAVFSVDVSCAASQISPPCCIHLTVPLLFLRPYTKWGWFVDAKKLEMHRSEPPPTPAWLQLGFGNFHWPLHVVSLQKPFPPASRSSLVGNRLNSVVLRRLPIVGIDRFRKKEGSNKAILASLNKPFFFSYSGRRGCSDFALGSTSWFSHGCTLKTIPVPRDWAASTSHAVKF